MTHNALIEAQNRALWEQNNAPSWRDCNAAGLPHRWEYAHATADASWWHCARRSCPVSTRTGRYSRPSVYLAH